MRCKRCGSKRTGSRLDGSTYCKRCGQRYEINGDLIPSADRRKHGEHGIKRGADIGRDRVSTKQTKRS